MGYEIRRTPKNKYQLRESSEEWHAADTSREGEPPILGEFDSTEAVAQYALLHAKGEFGWKPFEPQEELDRQRKQLEGR